MPCVCKRFDVLVQDRACLGLRPAAVEKVKGNRRTSNLLPSCTFPLAARMSTRTEKKGRTYTLNGHQAVGQTATETKLARGPEVVTEMKHKIELTWLPQRRWDGIWNRVNAKFGDKSG